MISFIKEDVDNGENASCKMCIWNEEGKRSIKLNGKRKNVRTGEHEEYPLERFEKYIAKDFSRFK